MTGPLTVLQLLPALESGGVERSTLEIADALVHAGHRALVVSAGGRLLPALLDTGAEHITLDIGRKSPLTLRHVRALRALCMHEHVDIVHARSRLPAWIGRLALRGWPAETRPSASGTPTPKPPAPKPPASKPLAPKPHFVTTVHGLNSPSRYSAVMAKGERVICVSRTVRDYVLRHYPATDPAILRVIPRGIEPAAFPRAPLPDRAVRAGIAAAHPQLGGDGPLLLMPGRGTRLKGHADALSLLATLRSDGIDARLWMPGARDPARADYIAELETRASSLGIADIVAITAPTNAIAEAYAASDLVLQLSRKPESFGRTVIEALSVGRPVLGWAHGGVGELLDALWPAGAIAPFDAASLHAAARALLASPAPLPVTIAQAILADYSLQAMQDATLAVYAEFDDEQSRR